jgi:hypothetical protein
MWSRKEEIGGRVLAGTFFVLVTSVIVFWIFVPSSRDAITFLLP